MTGHWQILASSRVPLAEMVKLDYLYVAGWSLWSDVKILLRTAALVCARARNLAAARTTAADARTSALRLRLRVMLRRPPDGPNGDRA